jgi:hypothetical protein
MGERFVEEERPVEEGAERGAVEHEPMLRGAG